MRAAIEQLSDDGWWHHVVVTDHHGEDRHVFPDECSALEALVLHTQRQFHLALRREIPIQDVVPPERFRIVHIKEH